MNLIVFIAFIMGNSFFSTSTPGPAEEPEEKDAGRKLLSGHELLKIFQRLKQAAIDPAQDNVGTLIFGFSLLSMSTLDDIRAYL